MSSRDAARSRTLSRRRALHTLVGGVVSAAGLVACQPARLIRRDPSRRLVLRINLFGSAAYAPLLLMRERRLLEEQVPGLAIEWKAIPEPAAVHDALRNGGLDLAVGPPTAFLLACEAGLPVRLVSGISALPCAIVGRAGLRSLRGLGPGDRIAVPEALSFEAAVLELAALREFGDPGALAATIDVRPHAEALSALQQGAEVAAHVALTPVLELALAGHGPGRLIDARELFGDWPTTALVYALPDLRERAAPLLAAFTEVLTEAARLALAEPLATARLLAEGEELRATPERIGAILAQSGWQPGPRLAGVLTIADLWRRTGRLRRTSLSWPDLAFAGVQGR